MAIQLEKLDEVREKAMNREITRKEAADMLGISIDYLYKRQRSLGLDNVQWITNSEKYPKTCDPRYMEYALKVSNEEMTVREAADALGITPPGLRAWMDKNGIQRKKIRWRGGDGNPCCVCAEHYCEWLLYGRPVPGWVAEKTCKNYGAGPSESYAIKSCPKYRKMETKRKH